jgi:hypothetical protein
MVLSHSGYYTVAEPVEATTTTAVAEPVEATTTTVAEPVEAQTTKANNHDPGGGTGYKPAPAKGYNTGKGCTRGAPLQHIVIVRVCCRGARGGKGAHAQRVFAGFPRPVVSFRVSVGGEFCLIGFRGRARDFLNTNIVKVREKI